MTPAAEHWLTAALDLSLDDRVELIEALLSSVDPPDKLPLVELWRDVIDRRSAELASGSVTSIPWVKAGHSRGRS